jgi:hypothetical protein
MGDIKGRYGFPSQVPGLRASDHDTKKTGRKKYEADSETGSQVDIEAKQALKVNK